MAEMIVWAVLDPDTGTIYGYYPDEETAEAKAKSIRGLRVVAFDVSKAQDVFSSASKEAVRGPQGRSSAAFHPGRSELRPNFQAWEVEWANPAVRAEFGSNYEAFLAYKRAEAQGLIEIYGGKTIRVESPWGRGGET
jgi:hypothetical protein